MGLPPVIRMHYLLNEHDGLIKYFRKLVLVNNTYEYQYVMRTIGKMAEKVEKINMAEFLIFHTDRKELGVEVYYKDENI